MSATFLRDGVRDELQRQIDAVAGFLTDRANDSFEMIRYNQGKIAGLRTALEILQQRFRDMH